MKNENRRSIKIAGDADSSVVVSGDANTVVISAEHVIAAAPIYTLIIKMVGGLTVGLITGGIYAVFNTTERLTGWILLVTGIALAFFKSRSILKKLYDIAILPSDSSIEKPQAINVQIRSINEDNSRNIHAGGDVIDSTLVAGDGNKINAIKNSQIGVIGDNTKVEGGINFKRE